MDPIQRMKYYQEDYTKAEQQIYHWIKQQPQIIFRCSIEEAALQTNTSKAAIIRFCKKIGYQGFAEFKFELSRYIISGEGARALADKEPLNTVKSITSLYEGYLRQFEDTLDIQEIKDFVKDIKKARRIKIIGNNRTGLSALQMRMRMSKIGYDAEAIASDMILVNVLQDILTNKDLVIIFSIWAKNDVYLELVKRLSKEGVTIALVTMTAKNALSKYCDYQFQLPWISKASSTSFLDDQALLFVFIEIVLAELAYK
jgi:DNA-binding MurR/RpiR family transcriptional regulator